MNLISGIIRPGKVLEVVDNFGTIKCSAPGLFTAEDDTDKLPPVIPFCTNRANSFSSPRENDEIWVISFNDNPLELFYMRKDDIVDNLSDILKDDYTDAEVIASRKSGFSWAQIYFTDGSGWIIKNDSSLIQIRKDGSILLDAGSAHRKIDICDNSISLGSEGGSSEPAVLGDKLVDALNILDNILSAISETAKTNPYTMAIGTTIDALQSMYSESIDKITSVHVTLD